MEYEVLRELKRSEKSVVHLVREKGSERVLIRKILKGQHEVYRVLKGCPHPFLPELYEVNVSDTDTTIMEEYIEGKQLDWKQSVAVVMEDIMV